MKMSIIQKKKKEAKIAPKKSSTYKRRHSSMADTHSLPSVGPFPFAGYGGSLSLL